MYQIKTPILAESANLAMEAARGVMSDGIEPRKANAAIAGARAAQNAVRVDVLTRLAAPKIAFLEAKQAQETQGIEDRRKRD